MDVSKQKKKESAIKWKKRFSNATKYCAQNRRIGEKLQDCVKRVLRKSD